MADIVRVLRVIEYVGERADVEKQVAQSVHGEKRGWGNCIIKAATIGLYPEILEQKDTRDASDD